MRNIFKDVLFSVAREDYKIEANIIKNYSYNNILTVCSGGCIPLSIKVLYPEIDIVAYDINPNQIDHCKKKQKAVANKDFDSLNIGKKNDFCLNQFGKFEKMFHLFRDSFIKNITNQKTIDRFFNYMTSNKDRKAIIERWKKNDRIKIPFQDTFNDEMIEKVFSDQATKQATPGTYVQYFQKKILNELPKPWSYTNPFLQHIFLGYYMSEKAFPYMDGDKNTRIKFFQGNICDISNIESFDFVSLSNLFDWSSDSFVLQCINKLIRLKTRSAILLRQLNNHRDWYPFFKDYFNEDKDFDLYWQEQDRSMFYDHFRLFIKK